MTRSTVQYCVFYVFFWGATSLKHAIHAMLRKNLQQKTVEKMVGPNRRWDLLRRLLFPDLAWLGLTSGLLCVYNARELGGGVIMVVSVGKLRRLVNVWVYRGYPVQLLCRCEWENHLSKTIFPAMFDDTGGWPTKIYLILVINTGNIARNMSTSGIEVGNIGMTKHST